MPQHRPDGMELGVTQVPILKIADGTNPDTLGNNGARIYYFDNSFLFNSALNGAVVTQWKLTFGGEIKTRVRNDWANWTEWTDH